MRFYQVKNIIDDTKQSDFFDYDNTHPHTHTHTHTHTTTIYAYILYFIIHCDLLDVPSARSARPSFSTTKSTPPR